MKYVYTIIRKDIPLADQIVQSCHSSLHAGAWFVNPEAIEVPALVLLQVKDKEALIALRRKLHTSDIDHYSFLEPYDDMGYTSITTGPLDSDERKVFSNYPLWRA